MTWTLTMLRLGVKVALPQPKIARCSARRTIGQKEIGKKVYELYGLGEEEIKIVEKI